MTVLTPHPEKSDLRASVSLMQAFGDVTRLRILALLSEGELAVTDVMAVLELSQSRVSTHLGKLREARLVADRKDGTSRLYRLSDESVSGAARRMLGVLLDGLDDALLEGDQRRLVALRAARASKQGWVESAAGRMERHYSPGRTWEALARGVVPLLSLGEVLDVGSGDGVLASLIAPHSQRYTCLDLSAKVLDAARGRLAGLSGVDFVQGDMEALPFGDASFDCVLCFHALTYAAAPRKALSEAARVLRPAGRLVVVTLAPHVHQSTTERYGHLRPGVSPRALSRDLSRAGLTPLSAAITSRETREPHFEVVTAVAQKPE